MRVRLVGRPRHMVTIFGEKTGDIAVHIEWAEDHAPDTPVRREERSFRDWNQFADWLEHCAAAYDATVTDEEMPEPVRAMVVQIEAGGKPREMRIVGDIAGEIRSSLQADRTPDERLEAHRAAFDTRRRS